MNPVTRALQARAHDGWRRDSDERARQGFGVHGAPAGRRDTLAKAIDRTNRKGSERAVRALGLVLITPGRMSALGANRTHGDGGNDVNDPLPPSAIQSSCVAVFLSSALSRIDVGTSRPSALAVVILSTVSYFTDNCTGRSAGFSLLRMRSTSASMAYLVRPI